MPFIDDTHIFQARPQRIISLVPSQTELLYDLGLEERVVGITKFCIHPDHWFRSKTRVGGTKTIDVQRVALLQPDLILANKEENVKEQIEALAAIAPLWMSDIQQLTDALHMIQVIGRLTHSTEKARAINNDISASFRQLKAGRPVRVLYLIWKDPWMGVGSHTFIDDMLGRAGWYNVLQQQIRYPELSDEDIRSLQPDWVLLSSEPYPFREKHIVAMQALLPAAKVILVDGELFSWYGSRLLQSAAYFNSLQTQP